MKKSDRKELAQLNEIYNSVYNVEITDTSIKFINMTGKNAGHTKTYNKTDNLEWNIFVDSLIEMQSEFVEETKPFIYPIIYRINQLLEKKILGLEKRLERLGNSGMDKKEFNAWKKGI